MKKIKAIFKLSRINEYYGTVALITAVGATLLDSISITTLLLLFIANLLTAVFAFMINDIEDSEDDKLDPKKRLRNPVSSGLIAKDFAWFVSIVVMLTSLLIFKLLGTTTVLYGIIAIGLGFAYSYKSIRLKSIPVLDIVSHGIFLGMIFVLTVLSISDKPLLGTFTSIYIMTSVFLGSIFGDLSNELRDIEVDKLSGIKNTAYYFRLEGKERLLSLVTIANFIMVFTLMIYRLSLPGQMVFLGLFGSLSYHIIFNENYSYKNIFDYPHKQKFLIAASLVLALL